MGILISDLMFQVKNAEYFQVSKAIEKARDQALGFLKQPYSLKIITEPHLLVSISDSSGNYISKSGILQEVLGEKGVIKVLKDEVLKKPFFRTIKVEESENREIIYKVK